jgi:hypothetical protein
MASTTMRLRVLGFMGFMGFMAAIGLAFAPDHADACGGTFCDGTLGPVAMPVDQTGENILFWIDRSGSEPFTEAHIQIQYKGDPERFAWLVPMRAAPEVLVGSQALFDNVLGATQPILTLNSRFDGNCGAVPVASGGGCGFGDDVIFFDDGFSTFGDTGDGWGEDTDGPDIIDRGSAGAFEYVVLTGDSVDVIVDWLDEAGYQQDPDAPPILEEYLQEGFVFVAFKLRAGVGLDEIHPVALRYPGVDPCIPIRLTRIAATEDMAIRAFFLGHDRAVPQNWPHVELNLAKLDWVGNAASSYLSNISLAIDEAGGRAFITEYAGTDAIVSLFGIENASWSASAFAGIEPVDVVTTLTSQGLMSCANDSCSYAHPQVLPLLQRYLPTPPSIEEDAFYGCLSCYEGLIDPVAWAAQPGFSVEYEERISGPARHAVDMLVEATYLTRLFTMISPHEMIEDPLLQESDSLGTVDNNLVATQVLPCDNAPTYVEVPGGREVVLLGSSYPVFGQMPSAERIERVPMVGPPQVETNNTEAIDEIIEKHNHDNLVGPEPGCSITHLRGEALLAMLALFGIAWGCRAPRARPKSLRPRG